MHQKLNRWVWIDLEMTGLDDATCAIIEIACIVTDPDLKELDRLDFAIWQPESTLAQMSPFVRSMHTKNGLLQRVRNSQTSLTEAENATLAMVTRLAPHKTAVLAGSSVWMDRRFLYRYMPHLENYLHHRQIDVSSVRILCQKWLGNRGIPNEVESTHTALEDIRATIEELKYLRQNCFVK